MASSATRYKEKVTQGTAAEAYAKSIRDDSGPSPFASQPDLEPVTPEHGLKRQLKNRHVAMISLAGVIGVGIFVNTVRVILIQARPRTDIYVLGYCFTEWRSIGINSWVCYGEDSFNERSNSKLM